MKKCSLILNLLYKLSRLSKCESHVDPGIGWVAQNFYFFQEFFFNVGPTRLPFWSKNKSPLFRKSGSASKQVICNDFLIRLDLLSILNKIKWIIVVVKLLSTLNIPYNGNFYTSNFCGNLISAVNSGPQKLKIAEYYVK